MLHHINKRTGFTITRMEITILCSEYQLIGIIQIFFCSLTIYNTIYWFGMRRTYHVQKCIEKCSPMYYCYQYLTLNPNFAEFHFQLHIRGNCFVIEVE